MSEDFMSKGGNSRDGYRPQSEGNGNGEHRNYNAGAHSQRPRFTRNPRPAGTGEYGQRGNSNYRPRYGNDGDYPQRQNNGGYQSRGYQSRENRWGKSRYGQNDEGYRPRYNQGNQNYDADGGYQASRREGGYQPRPQGGYQGGNRNGAYSQRGGQGGYRPRFQGQGGNSYNRPQQHRGNYDPHAKYSQKKRFEYKEENYDPTAPIRLNKFLANAGVCSRRDADKYIEAGVVSVNGQVVTELGAKVLRTDEIKFHDNAVKIEKKVYVLLNKPKGYVTTSEDPQNRKTVMDLVENACPERIYPVGRLDRNTTGVLLLTNDGELASKLTHPKFLKKKIYHVTTDQNVTAADIRRIAEGITLEDGEIKADAVEYAHPTDKKQVGIEIHSGKNRIVRRIFESMGYHVVKLDRVYFAGLTKKNVRRGDWRYLTEKEVQMLRMGAFE